MCTQVVQINVGTFNGSLQVSLDQYFHMNTTGVLEVSGAIPGSDQILYDMQVFVSDIFVYP